MGDYPRLVLTRWDQGSGRIAELQVYGPPPIAEVTRSLFEEGGAFWPDIVARTEHIGSVTLYHVRGGKGERRKPQPTVIEMKPNQVIEGKNWRVKAVGVAHVGPQLICYGFRLDSTEGSFVYSGDSGPCASMERLAEGCDVLVHMCHYISGTELCPEFAESCMGHIELAKLGAKTAAKTLVISHVTEQIDQVGVRERILREMAAIYDGNLVFGEDCMEIPIGSLLPAKLD
jgi:ribonuclease Z